MLVSRACIRDLHSRRLDTAQGKTETRIGGAGLFQSPEIAEGKPYDQSVMSEPLSILKENKHDSCTKTDFCVCGEDVPLVFMYLVLHACQVRVTVGDSGLCCCTCVRYFER